VLPLWLPCWPLVGLGDEAGVLVPEFEAPSVGSSPYPAAENRAYEVLKSRTWVGAGRTNRADCLEAEVMDRKIWVMIDAS
jgi:hypothetical protein